MRGPDDLIASFTAKQHGLIARWQALGVGITDRMLRRRVQRGDLILVHSGVYRLRGVPYTQELRWLAAVLAGGPDAWLSHRAAAAFQRYDIKRAMAEVSVPHGRECKLDGIIVHRTRRHGDIIVVDKIPVTTKARTALDCAAVLPLHVLEPLIQNAVTGGVVKIEALLAILDRRGGRGVDGTVRLRTALEGGLVDEKIQKRLELLVARIVRRARVPAPTRQHPLICADGLRVVLDNAWVDRKIAIEPDGERWHGNATQAAKTRARSRSITATGWEHYQYGWSDATERPAEMLSEIEVIWAGFGTRLVLDPAQNEEGDEERSA